MQLSSPTLPVVVVTWAQYGPYHFARLRALKGACKKLHVLGVEISSKTAAYDWARQDGGGEVFTLCEGMYAESIPALTIYRQAVDYFCRSKVSIVFVPSYWPASSLALILAARTVGAKVVMMNESHALTVKATGVWAELKRRIVLQFDAAFVGGTAQKAYFSSLGMDPSRIIMGYDAVDNDFFASSVEAVRNEQRREQVRAKHGLPARYFLNVGRMIWKKNLETLIDAYSEVRKRMGEECPRLVFVGSGKLEESIRERCLRHNLSVWQVDAGARQFRTGDADVYFYGFRQATELPEFYALAECFILPSREEEWGLVVNEAMACGLPVVVSRVAGCAHDLVQHGTNGFLVDPMSTTELANYLAEIAQDSDRAKRMGEASRNIISSWSCARFAAALSEAAQIALKCPPRN